MHLIQILWCVSLIIILVITSTLQIDNAECGRPFEPPVTVVKGYTTFSEKFPWNVAVYRKDQETNLFELICGGTLIYSNLVVSAAHCYWDGSLTSSNLTNIGQYKIAVGKYTRNISIIDHPFTEIIDVKCIYNEPDFVHTEGNYANDIAIIELATNVNTSYGVIPICVDWSEEYSIQNGNKGKIVGWGNTISNIVSPSPELLEASSLEFIDRNTCRKKWNIKYRKYITKDKFCARSKSGQAVESGDSGAGITFEFEKTQFLIGILSLKNRQTEDFIAAFTDVRSHIDWIRNIYSEVTQSKFPVETTTKSIPGNTILCKIPNTEGSLYFYNNKSVSPGTMVNKSSIILEECKSEYYKDSDGFLVCMEDGQWTKTYSNKLCLRKCPPMKSDKLDILCTLNGEDVDCSKLSMPGTKLYQKCNEFYTMPNGEKETPLTLHCLPNGKWNDTLYKICVPKCGRPSVTPVSSAAYPEEFPWNVAIFKKDQETNLFELMYGGTLIDSNLVVSAAHCFSKDIPSDKILTINGEYKIAVGKYTKDIRIIDHFTQIINVKFIYMPPDDLLRDGNSDPKSKYYTYGGKDIAIIELTTHATLSYGVMPICVDWSKKYSVQNGNKGKVVGWENQYLRSEVLRKVSFEFSDRFTCRIINLDIDFTIFKYRHMFTSDSVFDIPVTSDCFCTPGHSNASSEGFYGYNGAGLTFEFEHTQFLIGIVNSRILPYHYIYLGECVQVFTDVGFYIKWISNIHSKVTQSKPPYFGP